MPKLEKDQYSKAEVEELIRETGEAQTEALEVAKKEAALTDAEREIYKSLEGDAKHDFLFATAEERQTEVAKRQESNPVVYKAANGTEFRKNDDPRLVAMAKERDQERADFLKMQAEREQERFEKRATEELPNLPGDVKTRAAVLKAIEGIEDETVRAEALKSIKAHNAKMAGAFKEVGAGGLKKGAGETEGAAYDELERLAKEYQKAHPEVSFYDAYAMVEDANPDLAKRARLEG